MSKNQVIQTLKKMKKGIYPTFEKKLKSFFSDPLTYLELPYDADNIKYVIGKKPTGPRFDEEDKLIPYSVIGGYKPQQKKQFHSMSSCKVTRVKYGRANLFDSSESNTQSMDIKKRNWKEIDTNYLKEIFRKKRKAIEENGKAANKKGDSEVSLTVVNGNTPVKAHSRFIVHKMNNYRNNNTIEFPKIMEQYIKYPLTMQENSLSKLKLNQEKTKNIIQNIKKRMIQLSANKTKEKCEYKTYSKTEKNDDDLMINSGNNYFLLNESKKLMSMNNKPKFYRTNAIHNWQMSLRRPRNFKGTRTEYMNVESEKNPVWLLVKETNPEVHEKIINPNVPLKKEIAKYTKEIIPKDSLGTYDKIENFLSSSNGFNNLCVVGRKLIDVEEECAKLLKGKKRLIIFRNDPEELKDIKFAEDYKSYNRFFYK